MVIKILLNKIYKVPRAFNKTEKQLFEKCENLSLN